MTIVVKFGGSVLIDGQAYIEVALELLNLQKQYHKVYAVVSSKKGETERLMKSIAGDETPALQEALLGRSMASQFDKPEVAEHLIQGELASVDRLVEILGSTAIGIKQTEEYPIVARGSYLYGNVLLPESISRSKEIRHKPPIEIVSGFGAVNIDGHVVLLGRNASDYIAGLYGNLYNTPKIILYKDVDGVYNGHQKLEVIARHEFLRMGSMQVLDQRVLDVYGGEVVIQGFKSPRNAQGQFQVIRKNSTNIIGLY